jgi:hypothetical protein
VNDLFDIERRGMADILMRIALMREASQRQQHSSHD